MQLVDNNCVLYPRLLEFRVIPRPNSTLLETNINYTLDEYEPMSNNNRSSVKESVETTAQYAVSNEKMTEKSVTKRETGDNETMDTYETAIELANVTVVTGKLP